MTTACLCFNLFHLTRSL